MDTSSDEAVPVYRAEHLTDAAPFPSFGTYVDRCLYDPSFGYYSTGKVALAPGGHFGTFPQLLRPMFGHMLAEAAREVFDGIERAARVPDDARLSILELGGGDGTLAEQTLEYIVAREDEPRWRSVADRIEYVVGDVSPALRDRQRSTLDRHIRAGRAAVRSFDGRALDWDGEFYGLVVANELVDVFPCERLRLAGPDRIARIHVVPMVEEAVASRYGLDVPAVAFAGEFDAATVPVTGDSLWALLAGDGTAVREQVRFAELEVPLSTGWLGENGGEATRPAGIDSYLESIEPFLEDLAACDLLPVDLHASPALPQFVSGIAELLTGPDRAGAALLIDYGGTTRYVLDPRSSDPHIRVFGPDSTIAHSDTVYREPSEYDITWDIDFTEVHRLAGRRGLETLWFGHQSGIATPFRVQGLEDTIADLQTVIEAEGVDDPEVARAMVDQRIALFRDTDGFRAILLGSGSITYPGWFGPSDPVAGDELWTLSSGLSRLDLEAALAEADLPTAIANVLDPCGDNVADLDKAGYYQQRHDVLALLEAAEWLAAPGTVSG